MRDLARKLQLYQPPLSLCSEIQISAIAFLLGRRLNKLTASALDVLLSFKIRKVLILGQAQSVRSLLYVCVSYTINLNLKLISFIITTFLRKLTESKIFDRFAFNKVIISVLDHRNNNSSISRFNARSCLLVRRCRSWAVLYSSRR